MTKLNLTYLNLNFTLTCNNTSVTTLARRSRTFSWTASCRAPRGRIAAKRLVPMTQRLVTGLELLGEVVKRNSILSG